MATHSTFLWFLHFSSSSHIRVVFSHRKTFKQLEIPIQTVALRENHFPTLQLPQLLTNSRKKKDTVQLEKRFFYTLKEWEVLVSVRPVRFFTFESCWDRSYLKDSWTISERSRWEERGDVPLEYKFQHGRLTVFNKGHILTKHSDYSVLCSSTTLLRSPGWSCVNTSVAWKFND